MLRAAAQKVGGDADLKQQIANDIISGTNDAFSFTVLGRSVGTRHAKVNAVGQEECAGAEVVELAAVVALNSLNGDPKLCADISKKEGSESVRL